MDMEDETYPLPSMKFGTTNVMESVLRINLMLRMTENH